MRIKIKQSNKDKKIVIPFGGVGNLLGYDDDINSLISNETDHSINNVTDLEVKRFKSFINSFSITFNFWDGSSYQTQLAPLDFAANSLNTFSNEARNSFYVIQIFDSFDEDIQTKLHTGYFNGYDFIRRSFGGLSTVYTVDNITEFLSNYINNSFFEGKTGLITLYAKLFFYSAQSTKFYPFSYIQTASTLQEIYIPVIFDLEMYTYTYPTPNILFYEIPNLDYATLVNNTVQSIPIENSTFPTGNRFTTDGIYIEQ